MIKIRNRYTRGVIGVPTIVIVLFWMSIWFLWASVEVPKLVEGDATSLGISYLRPGLSVGLENIGLYFPDKFGARQMSFGVRDDNDMEISESMPGRRILRSRPYEREVSCANGSILQFGGGVGNMAMSTLKDYKDETHYDSIFQQKTLSYGAIKIESSDVLRKAGFSVPKFILDSIKKVNNPWQSTLFIEIDASGQPVDVFLLSGSGDQEVDTSLVKVLYQSEIVAIGKRYSGQVVVSSNGNAER